MPISTTQFDSIFDTFKETLGGRNLMEELRMDFPCFAGEFRTISLRLGRIGDKAIDAWIVSLLTKNKGTTLLLTRNHVMTECIGQEFDSATRQRVTTFSGNFTNNPGNKVYARAVNRSEKFNLVVVRDHQYFFSRPATTSVAAMRDLYVALEPISTDDIIFLFL